MANKTIPDLAASAALAAADEFPVSQGSAAATKGTFAKLGTLIGFLSGLATSVINTLTGAAIASAGTINLDTATGNRVHITGTTTITAITLTRGPRTLIFDGILTLTHNATTNNLPGAANITTAAGDRAIYESDGTTVYCITYIRANGDVVAPRVTVTGSTAPVNGTYLPAANTAGVATNSVLRLSVSTTAVVSTLPLSLPLAAVGTPSYSFTGDLNTGMWSSAADTLDFSAAGNTALQITSGSASAAHYIKVRNSASNSDPMIIAAGSSTNIALVFGAKGNTGRFDFYSDDAINASGLQFTISGPANAVNYMRVRGASAGSGPSFFADGGEGNIPISFVSSGSGALNFITDGAGAVPTQFSVSHTADAVNYLQATGGATGAKVILSAQGETSVDLGLSPKGSGAVIATGRLRLKGYTVATLPAGAQGDTAFVTDALTPTFLTAVVGGGSTVTTVFYNGANWVVQ